MKKFFNEKEVTSTLVMDALFCGCKMVEEESRNMVGVYATFFPFCTNYVGIFMLFSQSPAFMDTIFRFNGFRWRRFCHTIPTFWQGSCCGLPLCYLSAIWTGVFELWSRVVSLAYQIVFWCVCCRCKLMERGMLPRVGFL